MTTAARVKKKMEKQAIRKFDKMHRKTIVALHNQQYNEKAKVEAEAKPKYVIKD